MLLTFPTLSVSLLYCLSEATRRERARRTREAHSRRLRERVALMLWVAAHLDDKPRAVPLAVALGGGVDEED